MKQQSKTTMFQLPIGDFSYDGHGDCDHYLAIADKPFEDIRDAHFAIPERTGVDITTFACECQDNTIPDDDYNQLIELGYVFKQKLQTNSKGTRILTDETLRVATDIMADIWLFLLNKSDPELNCRLIPNEETNVLLFCGPDDKGRISKNVGYGLFD